MIGCRLSNRRGFDITAAHVILELRRLNLRAGQQAHDFVQGLVPHGNVLLKPLLLCLIAKLGCAEILVILLGSGLVIHPSQLPSLTVILAHGGIGLVLRTHALPVVLADSPILKLLGTHALAVVLGNSGVCGRVALHALAEVLS